MADVATLFIRVNSKEVSVGTVQLSALGKQASITAKKVDGVTESFKRSKNGLTSYHSSMKIIGRDMSRYITLPLLAAAGASLKFSKDLTTGMGQVQTLVAGTGNRIYELQDIVTGLSSATGRGFEDLTRGLYQTISAFQDGADTAGRFETAVKAGIAGAASTTEAITLLSAVTKAYGDTTEEATQRVADLAFATVKYGVTTFQELSGAIQEVTAVSSMLGVSQEELFSVYATLTGVGGNASVVTTGFNRALLSLMNPTQDLIQLYSQYADEQGNIVKSGEDFIRVMGGAVPALQEIVRVADETGKPIQKFITRQNGVRVALLLAGQQAETFSEKLELLTTGVGSAEEAYLAATNGINMWRVELQKALQRLKIVGAEVGEILLPSLVNLVQGMATTAEAFTRLDESTQRFIIRVAGLAAALGPLLIAFGSVLKAVDTFKNLGGLAMLAKIGPALASPAGLAAVAALAAGVIALNIVLKKNREYIEDLNKAATSSSGLFTAYEQLTYAIDRNNLTADQQRGMISALITEYPELTKEVDVYKDSLDDVFDAIVRINEQRFLETAIRDIRDAKKATRDYAVFVDGLQGTILNTLKEGFSDIPLDDLQQEADRIALQITSEIEWGSFDYEDFYEIRDRLNEIITENGLDENVNLPLGNMLHTVEQMIPAYKKMNNEMDNLSDIAGEFGFDLATVQLQEGGDLSKWRDYFVDLQILSKDASEDVAGNLGVGTEAGGDGQITKRLKTWADYFSEITGIAGEAFANIEYDAEGNAIGFIRGSGKLAAEAYAKAFADELQTTQIITDAVGTAFSAEDLRDTYEDQLDKTITDLFDLLNTKVRAGEINTEGLEFNIADLLTGDQASVERMLEVFGITDNAIQGMIQTARELKASFNEANIAVILSEVNDALYQFRLGADKAFSFQQDVEYFETLQEGVKALDDELLRLEDQGDKYSDAWYTVLRAWGRTRQELKGVHDSFSLITREMEGLPSIAEIAANAMYDLGRSIGLSQEASWALGEVFSGVAGAMVSELGNIASGFGEVYGQMLAGADVADRWDDIMGSFALSIAETLSQLAIQAGLQLIIAGASTAPLVNWALIGMGSALIAGGLAGQFAVGAVKGYTAEKEAQAQANATGGVYSGSEKLTKYAHGGVLGSYVNSIVDKPTYFANGTALMGEAGAEAIMPLTRTSSGDLGVQAVGMGGGSTTVSININNYASDSTEASATQNEDGSIDVNIVKKLVANAIADGSADRAMRSRYGTKVKGIN